MSESKERERFEQWWATHPRRWEYRPDGNDPESLAWQAWLAAAKKEK